VVGAPVYSRYQTVVAEIELICSMFSSGQMLSVILVTTLLMSTISGQDNANGQNQGDSLAVMEQGFSGTTDPAVDYDAYVKELYGDSEELKPKVIVAELESTEDKKRERRSGPAPGLFKNSRLNGVHLALNGSSPFSVSSQLTSWYSYIDAGVTIKMPYRVHVENLPLYTLFEVSSFNFENSFPEGGSFTGLAYILQASAIGENSAAVVGFGFWDGNMGSMMELNYRLRPTTNTFLRVGTRGVLISNVDPLGATWWLELRFSMGLEL